MEKAIEFVLSCMNFDGGFGCRPGSESHAGQVIYSCRLKCSVNFERDNQFSKLGKLIAISVSVKFE